MAIVRAALPVYIMLHKAPPLPLFSRCLCCKRKVSIAEQHVENRYGKWWGMPLQRPWDDNRCHVVGPVDPVDLSPCGSGSFGRSVVKCFAKVGILHSWRLGFAYLMSFV